MGERIEYEYGVACAMETYWPRWENWLTRFRFGRWLFAHWLAWDCDPFMHKIYSCGPHRVVRRTLTRAQQRRSEGTDA